MSYKSTIEISRDEAIEALDKIPYSEMTNQQLADVMEAVGFGDDIEKPYFGRNFIVRDTEEECEN